MTTREIVREIKEGNKKVEELIRKREELLKELQSRCKHINVTEWSIYYHDDWDRTSTTHYYRKCLCCGIKDSCSTYSYDYSLDKEVKLFAILNGKAESGEKKAEVEL